MVPELDRRAAGAPGERPARARHQHAQAAIDADTVARLAPQLEPGVVRGPRRHGPALDDAVRRPGPVESYAGIAVHGS